MCTFYLSAMWNSEEEASKAMTDIKEFITKLERAEDSWHLIRAKREISPVERYETLKMEHPEVYSNEFIGEFEIEESDKSMNKLAGIVEPPANESLDINQYGDTIEMSGEVWHFADWGYLARYMKCLGAVKSGWMSEEGMEIDPFGQIVMQ